MGERKHKAESGEKEAKAGQGKKASAHVAHPILQLQQLVGNKAVTRMIHRQEIEEPAGPSAGKRGGDASKPEPEDSIDAYNFRVHELSSDRKMWIGGRLLRSLLG